MFQGIELCKDNAKYLMDDARTLVKKSTRQAKGHAIALIVLAIEELGKAKVLSDRLQQSKRKGLNIVEVEKNLFELHKPKFHEGCSLLPSEALIIDEADFHPENFHPEDFMTEDVEANPEIRLETTFVDWDDVKKKWKIGTPATPERIDRLIIEVEKALGKITIPQGS